MYALQTNYTNIFIEKRRKSMGKAMKVSQGPRSSPIIEPREINTQILIDDLARYQTYDILRIFPSQFDFT